MFVSSFVCAFSNKKQLHFHLLFSITILSFFHVLFHILLDYIHYFGRTWYDIEVTEEMIKSRNMKAMKKLNV